MAAKLVTIWWRDIPAQVNGQNGRHREKNVLSDRFQVAIDRAAMVAEITTTDAYVQEWRRTTAPCDGDLAEAARAEADRLETEFDSETLKAIVSAGGYQKESQ